jgi:signal transduction histidine kinase
LQRDLHVMDGLVMKMITSTRRIATGLRPSILDQLGLIAALRWLARDSEALLSIPCEIAIDDQFARQPFEPTLSITVFRITQELLTNVARHAKASRVVVEAAYEAPYFVLTVHDNGRGITEQELSNPHSLGLRGIRERVALLGGELEIHGLPGEGTSVQARIPAAPCP